MEFRAAAINTSDADLAAHHAALKTTVDWLQSMRDQLSEPRRLDAMTKALTKAGVPRALWPNVDGTFGG